MAGLGPAASAVLVVVSGPVPLTATFSAALLPLRLLLVTVMLALRLPTDCGVNSTETSHTSPAASDVPSAHRFVSPEFSEKFAVYAGLVAKTRGRSPMLVTVAVCGLLVAPTTVLGNASAAAERFTSTRRLKPKSGTSTLPEASAAIA